jgi:ABC-type multidrug transport system ATPase subunit
VADNDASKIRSEFKNKSVLTVEFDKKADIAALQKIQGVIRVNHSSGNHYLVEFDAKMDLRIEIAKYASLNGLLILQMNVQASNLENIFKDLTSA